MSLLQAVKGMNDFTPEQCALWQRIESICHEVLNDYAYQEIRFPIVEHSDLFQRAVGLGTDIVEKEMFTFEDRLSGDSLTLRPEGTASCVRACLNLGLIYNQQRKLWYRGPMFRHERPQKGRYRQFHQLGVECFGVATPDADLEMLLLCNRLWQRLGLTLSLELNCLGTYEERARYREQLVAYYQQHFDQLDEDSERRLSKNPLRILDSKNPDMKTLNQQAPSLMDYLGEESKTHFETLCAGLKRHHIAYTLNPCLVRGLDYYNGTVFEWTTTDLGAQATVCAGGRYDGLVAHLGGQATPAIGFALGLERLELLLAQQMTVENKADVYCVLLGTAAESLGLIWAEALRTACPGLRVQMNLGGGSFKNQLKKADKSGATWALVMGDEEVAAQKIILKYLRTDAAQQLLSQEALIDLLKGEIECLHTVPTKNK